MIRKPLFHPIRIPACVFFCAFSLLRVAKAAGPETTLLLRGEGAVAFSVSRLVEVSPVDLTSGSSMKSALQTGIKKPPPPAAAFLLSLALPGSGEYISGSRRMAAFFFSTEVLVWSAFACFRIAGDWKAEDYRQYAAAHAGVDLSGKDHDYFVHIENYDNLREYNEAKLRQRDPDSLYPEDGHYAWDWDSEASRLTYETLRIQSDRAYDNSKIVAGLILVNHIVSAIDALRASRSAQRAYHRRLQVGLEGLPEGGAKLVVLKRF